MASTVAALSNVIVTVAPVAASTKSSFCGTSLEGGHASTRATLIRKSSTYIICMADGKGKPSMDEIAGAVDKNTKVDITPESVEQNMQKDSEQKSVVGTKPSKGATIPRPEMERRPETGERSFFSIMAFDGPGPETINGRLAMLGCLWGFISEVITGQRIVDQVNYPGSPGLFWLLTSAQIIIWASLIPMFNGESPDSRKSGPFTAKAERWNGRLAMVGFAGILLNEALRHQPVFPHLF